MTAIRGSMPFVIRLSMIVRAWATTTISKTTTTTTIKRFIRTMQNILLVLRKITVLSDY